MYFHFDANQSASESLYVIAMGGAAQLSYLADIHGLELACCFHTLEVLHVTCCKESACLANASIEMLDVPRSNTAITGRIWGALREFQGLSALA